MTHQSRKSLIANKESEEPKKVQVGFRLDPVIDREIRDYAAQHERQLTWIFTKVIRLGWAAFLQQNKVA
jgi:hypothetical protein